MVLGLVPGAESEELIAAENRSRLGAGRPTVSRFELY